VGRDIAASGEPGVALLPLVGNGFIPLVTIEFMAPIDDFSRKMNNVYDLMDEAYDSVQRHYGFGCKGCRDNCCTQRFHHHTLAEYHYLKEGLKQADPELARQILRKARVVVESYQKEQELGEILPLMCPVNFEGLCRLYEHRPMICRMHGLPHRFKRSDGREERGGGCARFGEAHPEPDWTVDRTKGYTALARIEGEIRKRTMNGQRVNMTTAEMLMQMLFEDPELQELIEVD
jgi:Fe-S-cluster containining protein